MHFRFERGTIETCSVDVADIASAWPKRMWRSKLVQGCSAAKGRPFCIVPLYPLSSSFFFRAIERSLAEYRTIECVDDDEVTGDRLLNRMYAENQMT